MSDEALDSASRMVKALCLKVGLVRLFWSIKCSYAYCFSKCGYGDAPCSASSLTRTHKPRFASSSCPFCVLIVCVLRNISQVAESVIASNIIDMVNYVLRPLAMNVKPSKSVAKIFFAFKFYRKIAPLVGVASRDVANVNISVLSKSGENTRLGIVVQKFFEPLLGQCKIVRSHAVVLLRQWFGQKPACASNACGLRYFNPQFSECLV